MIYRQRHKTNGSRERRPPLPGSAVVFSPGERERRRMDSPYTPERAAAILEEANSGDIAGLAIAAREILERNWDVLQAFDVRRNALLGLEWSVEPGDESPEAAAAARKFARELADAGSRRHSGSFHQLLATLENAVIAPLGAAEIAWGPGGTLDGFTPVGAWNFTLRDTPEFRLVTDDAPQGIEPPPDKFILLCRTDGADSARGGLIRCLLWLHVFQNFPIKDLLGFVERFGMPFVVAKVDHETYENERAVLKSLIRSFGPSGGGVFTRATELEMLQASNNSGDVYFKLLDYTGKAITKVILGQLASSSESSGISGGDAQSQVRSDILAADCRAIESVLRTRLAAVWTRFNYGADTAVPNFRFTRNNHLKSKE